MIAELLALPGIALLAAGTPRQAHLLSPYAFGQARRRRLRAIGLLLLACSLALAGSGDDRARQLVRWVCAIGFEALGTALAFTLLAARQPER